MRHPKTGDYCVGCNLVAEAVAEVKGESKVVKVNEDKPELKARICKTKYINYLNYTLF